MKQKEMREKLREGFKQCALSRRDLRKTVVDSMKTGFTKKDILALSDELGKNIDQHEVSLCSITAIGQALKFEEEYEARKSVHLSKKESEAIKEKLKRSFEKCGLARKQLRDCIVNVMTAGFSKEEILAITDDIVGGLGKNEVSACAIVAVDEVLRYQETLRAKPIDIVKERKYERGDS